MTAPTQGPGLGKLLEFFDSEIGRELFDLLGAGLQEAVDASHRANRAAVLCQWAEDAKARANALRLQAGSLDQSGQIDRAKEVRVQSLTILTTADELVTEAQLYERKPAAVLDDVLQVLVRLIGQLLPTLRGLATSGPVPPSPNPTPPPPIPGGGYPA